MISVLVGIIIVFGIFPVVLGSFLINLGIHIQNFPMFCLCSGLLLLFFSIAITAAIRNIVLDLPKIGQGGVKNG